VTRAALVLALSLSAFACGPQRQRGPAGPPPPSAPSPLYEGAAPDFSRPSLGGAKVDTAALRGQMVVVKFFAKYCEPCKRTLPAAQKLHVDHPEVAFIGISEDESQGDAQALVAAYGLTFPVVMDRGNVLAGRFRVSEIPVTFVIDAQGVVRWVGGPSQSEDDLARAVASLASP
jgi:cytochrome c biogenesis protein CcmG/thiol:disulfide interchange protein DsbE